MFDKQPSLANERIRLHPLVATDFDGLYAVASDPALWALHPAADRWQEPVFRRWFQESLASGGTMVVIDQESGRIIGSSRYNVPEPGSGRAEIGWSFLARAYWGGNWNRAVKQLLLAHAFHYVEIVYFRVGETNLRSRRAMEKLGARLTDKTEILDMPDGTAVTHVIFEISKADFQAEM
jgi:RimJ/RimL family protein N-acetyltransferase